MHPHEGQTTATHPVDPAAYEEALRAQAHAWEDRDHNDEPTVTGEAGR
jgi:hypothetical protein